MNKENGKRKEQQTHPPITTFRSLQDIQAHFCLLNNFSDTPEGIWKLLQGELLECKEAIGMDDTAEIKGELADILIFSATVANLMNFDLHTSITNYDTAFTTETPTDETIKRLQHIRNKRRTHDIKPDMMITYLQQYTDAVEQADQIQNDKKEIIHALSIISVGVMDMANDYQINLTDAVTQKIARNYSKYNPHKRKQLLDSGLPPDEAYKIQKGQWDRGHDKKFVK